MKVALVSPVWFPVPPGRYGGIESIVHLLADGLVEAGVDVTLFASGESRTRAALVSAFDTAPSDHIGETFWELRHALPCVEALDEYDVVHDHTGLLGLCLFGLAGSAAVVHTVHGPLDGDAGTMYASVCRVAPEVGLVSLTRNQRRPRPALPWLATVPNAIDPERYAFSPGGGEYLAFLGRMSPDKGAHRAIAVARAVGLPLRMAAKCREPDEIAYFQRCVEPHLDGQIEYLGEIDHEDKVELLRGARALLFPISWEEPFGLVMIEALACGTPVIGTRCGSVPEVIEDGVTGAVVDDLAAMTVAVEAVTRLDPWVMRSEVERRFSPKRLLDGYLEAYERACAGRRGRARVERMSGRAAPQRCEPAFHPIDSAAEGAGVAADGAQR